MPTLTIKRIHFENILSGRKRFEYRKITPFYEAIFSRGPKGLRLHYYQRRKLEVDVVNIRRIATPNFLVDRDFGSDVFEIELANPRLLSE